VLAGAKSARIAVDEITLYKSAGIAIQDVATAVLVYRKASQLGVGTNAEI
jgi:alanine dehydrogenase